MSKSQSFGSIQEELEYYKQQYAHLESELQEFQQSSKELEAELEKDVEASEKRERELRDQVDAIGFQANEWKNKYNQSRTESTVAQNRLQKEITTLRETNRTLQIKLRDMEVANDEYEVMARNTTTSLDDLELKHNQAVERNILLEDEIKQGEQERELLRIETQRLKDELSDSRVENEIVIGKLRAADSMKERRAGILPQEDEDKLKRPSSTYTDRSVTTVSTATTRSHHISRSEVSASEPQTPPSPQYTDRTGQSRTKKPQSTPSKLDVSNHHDDTPRPEHVMQKKLRARPSYGTRRARPSVLPADALVKLDASHNPDLPESKSLYQIRGLRDKMQKLEERLHTVKSRLPNPPPSPCPAEEDGVMPASITMRSPTKRRSVLPLNHYVIAPPSITHTNESSTSTWSPRPPVPPKDEHGRSTTSQMYRSHDEAYRSSTSQSCRSSEEQAITSPEANLPPRPSSRMSISVSRPPSSSSGVRQEEPEPTTHNGRNLHLETGSLRRPRASEAQTPIRLGGTLGRSNFPLKSRPSVGSVLLGSTAGTTTGTNRRKSNIARPGLGSMFPPERRV
jgi:hypothetical protein